MHRELDVPVPGGQLHVGIWESDDVAGGATPGQLVLAVHGVTSSHRVWPLVATRLTALEGYRVIAPDLRGRGRSAGLPGPWGLRRHADDVAAVLDALAGSAACSGDDPGAVVVGHSMGAFVTMVLGHTRPDLVRSMVLVDGGVPLEPSPGLSPQQALAAILGPAADRLAVTFTDVQEYRDFWRSHSAFAGAWSPTLEQYADYDLTLRDGALRSASRYEAVAHDSAELWDAGPLAAAWRAPGPPRSFLRAPLGLLAEPPGLYPVPALRRWQAKIPGFTWTEVERVNHYTIVLDEVGADRVAAQVQLQAHPGRAPLY